VWGCLLGTNRRRGGAGSGIHSSLHAVSSVDSSLARNKQENEPTLDDRPIADAGKEKRKTPRSCGDGADRPLLSLLVVAERNRLKEEKIRKSCRFLTRRDP
jgi:hypothetical protein